jgi:polyferredoxin
MLRALRSVAALAVFVGINLFFLGFSEGTGVLARIQFVPACLAFNLAVAGTVVAVTAVAGRLYCSVVCPLGILQDIALWLRRRFRRTAFAFRPGRPVVRIVAAVLFVVLLLCGLASLAGVIEPYSAYGRIATHLFEPLAAMCANMAADLATRWGHPCMLKTEIFVRGWAALGVAVVSFAVLTVLAAWRGRLFCNTVCPVGALLGLLTVKAPIQIRLDAAKCVKCGLCAKACKAECIDAANGIVDQSRCVRCFDCLGTCRKEALSWK